MTLTRNKLYFILIIACIAGYFWLFSSQGSEKNIQAADVCLIKHVTKIPCPSCGSTRSVISLTQGNFSDAMLTNPLGYVIAMIMIVLPLWLLFDIGGKRKSLFAFYNTLELYLKRPKYAIPLVLLVIINWIWNITKGL